MHMKNVGVRTRGTGGGVGNPRSSRTDRSAHAAVSGPATMTLCGSLTVAYGDRTIGARQLGGAKPRQILVALVLRPGQALGKASLVRLLWGDAPPPGALSTLEGYVSLLRKRLEVLGPALAGAVLTVPGGYQLDLTTVEVDVHRFRALAASARSAAPADAVQTYAAAIAAVDGSLLPDERLDWLDEARHQLDHEQLEVLTDAAETALAAGELDLAQRWARRAISLDAYDEPAWRVVLECCERRGLHAEGLRAYDECRRLLAEELGCAPGPAVREVFGRLLEQAKRADGDPLGALVDAVVRLHVAVSRTSPAGGSGVEDDWRLLEHLLDVARGRLEPGRATA